MAAEFSLGPWTFHDNGVLTAREEIVLCADMGWARQPSPGDRALIAAAPDLYAALMQLGGCRSCGGTGRYLNRRRDPETGDFRNEELTCTVCAGDGLHAAARAALAKARGEAA